MKRFGFLLFLLVALLLCICVIQQSAFAPDSSPDADVPGNSSSDTSDDTDDTGNSGDMQDAPPADDKEDVFVPPEIHPDTVGIYIPAEDGTRARKRITEFTAKRTAKKDIDCFEILASREDLVKGSSFAGIWNGAWDSHRQTDGAKIGFIIEFSLSGGKNVHAQILKPSDSADFFDYLEVYLYDDIHQTPGVWYTHLEDADMKEETVISSIKLTSGSRIAEVGDIYLTAFIYQGQECFDENGDYCGEVLETICITEE